MEHYTGEWKYVYNIGGKKVPESSRLLFSGSELSLCMLPVLCCERLSSASADDKRSLEQLITLRVPLYTRYNEYASPGRAPGRGGGGGGGRRELEPGRSDSERVAASTEDL